MNTRYLLALTVSLSLLALYGCGGGGGGGSTPVATVVSGVASKGPISGGTIRVFAIQNGVVNPAPLGSGTTGTDGSYAVNIGTYSGPVLVDITGGNYTDEATGSTLPLGINLRAMVPAAVGTVTTAVTALTEMAVQKALAAGSLTDAAIRVANNDIGSLFGVNDIVGTLPIDVTTTASATAPAPRREYGMALAAVSRYMQNTGRSLGQSVTDFSGPVTGQLLIALDTARTTFIQSASNKSGITGNTTASKATLKISSAGTLTPPARIGGVEVVVNLPPGISVPLIDAVTGEVDPAAVFISGVAVTTGTNAPQFTARFAPATVTNPATIKLVLVNIAGFGTGEFATMNLNKTIGSVATPAHFVLTGFTAVDSVLTGGSLGGVIPGITSTLTASF
ncbi:hypothetical protein [Geomobilimonas luticola]|uniref:Carboxypeptidase regulatory-like domain-containing protein n=1 Tax=Geomobilimonas luticola TaxID=1114878 RepID=A0ABS5SE31_9BACT|nr:hypothetical protein [Geomobilimonas luticola]MBT0652769.1 hypothetical protein [Geomobilimonas luticola]